MALSKANKSTESEMLFSLDEEQVSMGINQEVMQHIIARLTDLYTDPIAATVREVVSNAIDSTKLLPKEKQKSIHITLPTSTNPIFKVEDKGIGMTKDTMSKIYVQYGSSTKGDDFSQIGAFGLGAKAPLSYCDSFFVTSIKDGMLTKMNLTKEPTGFFAHVIEHTDTNKENGTIVEIPVTSGDSNRFCVYARDYKKYSVKSSIVIENQEVIKDSGLNFEKKPFFLFSVPVEKDKNGEDITVDLYVNGQQNAIKVFDDSDPKYSFIMSGWKYDNPLLYSRYGSNALCIDLIPGLVDFSSSRDEITNNARLKSLHTRITNYLTTKLTTEMLQTLINNDVIHESELVYYLRNSYRLSSKIQKVKTKSGVCLYELMNNEKDEVGLFFTRETPSWGVQDDLYLSEKGRSSFTKTSATSIKDKAEALKTVSILSHILKLPREYRDSEREIYIISDCESKDKKYIVNKSKQIKDGLSKSGVSFLCFTESKSFAEKKLKKYVEYIPGKFNINYFSIKEFREEMAKHRKKSVSSGVKKVVDARLMVDWLKIGPELRTEGGAEEVSHKNHLDADLVVIDDKYYAYGSRANKLNVTLMPIFAKDPNKEFVKVVIIQPKYIKNANVQKIDDFKCPVIYIKNTDGKVKSKAALDVLDTKYTNNEFMTMNEVLATNKDISKYIVRRLLSSLCITEKYISKYNISISDKMEKIITMKTNFLKDYYVSNMSIPIVEEFKEEANLLTRNRDFEGILESDYAKIYLEDVVERLEKYI